MAYLLLVQPITSKLDAVTVTVSEASLALLFTLVIGFQFDISSSVSTGVEIAAVICMYTAISVPSIAGFISLIAKLREMLKYYAKMKYAVRVYHSEIYIDTTPAHRSRRQLTPLAD